MFCRVCQTESAFLHNPTNHRQGLLQPLSNNTIVLFIVLVPSLCYSYIVIFICLQYSMFNSRTLIGLIFLTKLRQILHVLSK